jgi:hypothetical protein
MCVSLIFVNGCEDIAQHGDMFLVTGITDMFVMLYFGAVLSHISQF